MIEMPFIAGCSEPLPQDVQLRRGDAKSSGGIIRREFARDPQSDDSAALLFGSSISHAEMILQLINFCKLKVMRPSRE